uniref:Prostate-associated microseminoprotein n=1 Tax=Seriola dumerili TaxID=41447 RepID=A0A3B4TUP2_SERDU
NTLRLLWRYQRKGTIFPMILQIRLQIANKHYSLGETWMDNACMQCTCLHPVGVGCCETVHRPVDFPAWCEVRVEPVSCKVSLVQAADPRLPCSPGEDFKDPTSHCNTVGKQGLHKGIHCPSIYTHIS